ncbi:MAG: hypothetical protein FWC76_08390 [Defluviitaleaceae bacterium]|nr:hypothetical protein [Defluviitaleaceae bacterium]
MKNYFIKIIILLVVVISAACSSQSSYCQEPYIPAPLKYEPLLDPIEVKTIEPQSIPEPIRPVRQASSWHEAYATILNAYAKFELSDFTLLAEDLMERSIIAVVSYYSTRRADPIGWDRPSILYVFHDLNGDGIPELFIGANGAISGIYTLQDGQPVSLIQVGWHDGLALTTDVYDNYIIQHMWGRMSHGAETIYGLDENGHLFMRDRLITHGHWWRYSECGEYPYIYGFYRARYIDGEEVSITEEEYVALLMKYGIWGYFPMLEMDEPRFVDLAWEPILSVAPIVQQISSFGKQAAIDFLSDFPSIFQGLGLRDSNTGGFYAWTQDGLVEISTLSPSDVPLVFQSGLRHKDVPSDWYSDSWGIFFGNSFYSADGSLITDVPFIREASNPYFGTIAESFTLFDFDGSGIPDIVIEFVGRGVNFTSIVDGQGWGMAFHGPFVLYRFIDGAYREVGYIPVRTWGHHGFAMLSYIYLTQSGEKLIFAASDGHTTPRAYNFRLTENSMEIEPIFYDFYDGGEALSIWFNENHPHFVQIQPLIGLQNEIIKLLAGGDAP